MTEGNSAADSLRLPPLSERLRKIAEAVPYCGVCADIGCDHGYISIWLTLTGRAKACIASDVNEGPLSAAKSNALLYHAENISFLLSDGLCAFGEGAADVYVISGMGGPLMVRILSEGEEKLKDGAVLILEPQSEAEALRRYLYGHGFLITDDFYIKDESKIYPVIKAVKNDAACPVMLKEEELHFGHFALMNKDPLLYEELKKRLAVSAAICDKLEKETSKSALKSRNKHEEYIRLVEKAMNYYTNEIILASGSPRRKELLEAAGFKFTVKVSDADENIDEKNPGRLVEALSAIKCESVAETVNEGLVLGADTVVYLNGEILTKPKDDADAVRMLKELSGGTHQVYTGVTLCLVKEGQIVKKDTFSECTDVHVAVLSEEEIYDYVKTGEPSDKAGAYAIQGYFSKFVTGITGEYSNVVGLPVAAVYSHIMAMTQSWSGL